MPDKISKPIEQNSSPLLTVEQHTGEVPQPQAPILEAEEHIQPALLAFEATELQPMNYTAPPQPVIQAAVAQKTKLVFEGPHQLLGGLTKADRYQTHSDTQRMAAKQNLQNSAELDLNNRNFSGSFRETVRVIFDYTKINATAGRPDLVRKENELLQKIRQELELRFNKLNAMWAQGEPPNDQVDRHAAWVMRKNGDAELDAVLRYQNIFNAAVDGSLQVPLVEIETQKLEDRTHLPLLLMTEVLNSRRGLVGYKDSGLKFEDKSANPLFPHEPSINDIRQGRLGDCYLLAGLAAIVHQDPQFIKSCMRDNGNGTVTVRFFSKDEEPVAGAADPQTVTHYVTVEKRVPENDKFAMGCLWVQIIERAYAASGLHRNPDIPVAGPSYIDIAGGLSGPFVFAMTGRVADVRPLVNDTNIDYLPSFVRTAFQTTKKGNPGAPQTTTLENLLGIAHVESPEEFAAKSPKNRLKASQTYLQHSIKLTEIITAVIQDFAKLKNPHLKTGKLADNTNLTYIESLTTQQEMVDLIMTIDYKKWPDSIGDEAEKFQLLSRVATAAWKELSEKLHNTAFSGRYNDYALEQYKLIENKLAAGKYITAGTYKFVPDGVKLPTGKNAEQVREGLAEGHAYTVLGVTTVGSNRFVKLRNPWGNGTREYLKAPDEEIARQRKDEGTEGIFLMELNEFVSTIRHLDFN